MASRVPKRFKNIRGINENFKSAISSGVNILGIAYNTYNIVNCIKDNININGDAKEKRDAAKIIYDQSKMALDQLREFRKALELEIDSTNAEVDKLVHNTNIMLRDFQAGCETNNASIISDLEELKFFVEVLRRNINMKIDIESERQILEESIKEVVKEKKEEMEQDGQEWIPEQEEQYRKKKILIKSKRSFRNVKLKNPKVDPDVILMVMRNSSKMFEFPNERWSKWSIIAKDSNCSCNEAENICLIQAKRTCLTKSCFGEPERTYDRCEKEKFLFFKRCRAKDQTLVGSCLNKKSKSVSTGDISGYYVSVGVQEKQCYKDCKNLPGSVGCQFHRKICPKSDKCRGECFVVFDEIHSTDKMADVVCYKFKEPTQGSPGNIFCYDKASCSLPTFRNAFPSTHF